MDETSDLSYGKCRAVSLEWEIGSADRRPAWRKEGRIFGHSPEVYRDDEEEIAVFQAGQLSFDYAYQ